MATTKSQQMRFEFGWKHWSGRKFKQKKAKHAGWGRVWDAPRLAMSDDCLEVA